MDDSEGYGTDRHPGFSEEKTTRGLTWDKTVRPEGVRRTRVEAWIRGPRRESDPWERGIWPHIVSSTGMFLPVNKSRRTGILVVVDDTQEGRGRISTRREDSLTTHLTCLAPVVPGMGTATGSSREDLKFGQGSPLQWFCPLFRVVVMRGIPIEERDLSPFLVLTKILISIISISSKLGALCTEKEQVLFLFT